MPNRARKPTQIATLRLIAWTWNSVRILTPNTLKSRNQDWPYSQISRKPPDQATMIPEKMSNVVETVRNCK